MTQKPGHFRVQYEAIVMLWFDFDRLHSRSIAGHSDEVPSGQAQASNGVFLDTENGIGGLEFGV